jgi:hypothetical protein
LKPWPTAEPVVSRANIAAATKARVGRMGIDIAVQKSGRE